MRPYLLIVSAGLIARLLCLAVADPMASVELGDSHYYLAMARSLHSGTYLYAGEPSLFRPWGYPLFLAMPLMAGPAFVIGLQLLLPLATACLTFRMLQNLPLALLLACLPALAFVDMGLAAETLAWQALWVGSLLLWKRRLWSGGALVGVAILSRDMLILLPFFALGLALLFRRDLLKPALVATMAALLVVAPWPIRNAAIGKGFVLGEGRFGTNLWVGTWERNGDWLIPGGMQKPRFPNHAFSSPAERTVAERAWSGEDDKALRRIATDRIIGDPISVFSNWAFRYPRLWLGTRTDQTALRLEPGSHAWTAFKAAMWGLHALLLLVGTWGIWRARRAAYLPFVVPIAYVAAVYIPFHNVETRYSLIVLPFLCLFATYRKEPGCTKRRARPGPTETQFVARNSPSGQREGEMTYRSFVKEAIPDGVG